MSLQAELSRIRKDLESNRFRNEAAVSQSAVVPILEALEWPVRNTDIVAPEFTLEKKRVDFALCYPEMKPKVFVEVKQVGRTEGADRQLFEYVFEYAFHAGVPMAVLTDGQEWHFYLPGELGAYQERRVYKLDLLEQDLEECADRLRRYLSYENVRTGDSIKAARKDYQNISKERQIEHNLPIAWAKLIEERDEFLVEVIADKVESLCSYKPDQEVVHAFLSKVNTLYRVPEDRTRKAPSTRKTHIGIETTKRKKRAHPRGAAAFPPDGTRCRTNYPGCEFEGRIEYGRLRIPGLGEFTSFSAPFRRRGKSVNGWTAWEIKLPGSESWSQADAWRDKAFRKLPS